MLGGAWVRTNLGANAILFEGRTFGDGDAAVLGLDGDGGADTGFTMPAGWPTLGVPGEAISEVQRQQRTVILGGIEFTVDDAAITDFEILRTSGPWRITLTCQTGMESVVSPRLVVAYLHSITR